MFLNNNRYTKYRLKCNINYLLKDAILIMHNANPILKLALKIINTKSRVKI